ncbi:MgtE intracellular N domain-containing protein [Cohaesibacter marisflavi]|uniref:MgtE intracellular N domain-containing protein n=1 Tax=Cohaesibacter marisflavi TaxID=655353 RepID=A0A1I5C7M6_9HYPH|nr:MotE family protein [Cohaesibacter marisflavi]SFN83015.1 MgtE intracellular N domain-containing protein [Cohaesibacter marisflavi]
MSNSDGLMGKYFSLHSSLGTSLLQIIGLVLAVSMANSADAKAPANSKTVEAGISSNEKAKTVDQIDANSFCENISDLASEQRYAWQLQNLIALQSDIDGRIEKLEALRADVKGWIAKRDKVLSDVKEHIITVYERMRPEAAAERLAAVDDQVAIALLAKMKPRVVSAILNEMDAAKASDLTQEMASLVEIKSGERDQ